MTVRTKTTSVLAILTIVLVCTLSAQDSPQPKRVASVQHLMKGLMVQHHTTLDEAVKSPPQNAADWKNVELAAALLNEASYSLLENGRAADAIWEKAVLKLRVGSAQAFTAAQAKEDGGLRLAVQTLTTACADCHAAHRQ